MKYPFLIIEDYFKAYRSQIKLKPDSFKIQFKNSYQSSGYSLGKINTVNCEIGLSFQLTVAGVDSLFSTLIHELIHSLDVISPNCSIRSEMIAEYGSNQFVYDKKWKSHVLNQKSWGDNYFLSNSPYTYSKAKIQFNRIKRNHLKLFNELKECYLTYK